MKTSNKEALEKRLKKILANVKPQRKLSKKPDNPLLFGNLSTSKSKDSHSDAMINRSKSTFSYYKPILHQQFYRNSNNNTYYNQSPSKVFSSKITKERSRNVTNSNRIISMESLSMKNSKKHNKTIKALKQERVSLNDLKQTEADTSFDKKISLGNITMNCNPFYLQYIRDINKGANNTQAMIMKSKLSNIPENSNNSVLLIKRKQSNYLSHHQMSERKNRNKLFLKHKTTVALGDNDKNEYYNLNFPQISSKKIIHHSKYYNSNMMLFDEYNNSSDSTCKMPIPRPRTSRSIKHLFIQCKSTDDKTRPCIQRNSFENSNCSTNPNLNNSNQYREMINLYTAKLGQFISQEYINDIKAKCDKSKDEKIKEIITSLEIKLDKQVPQPLIRNVPTLTISLLQKSVSLDKSKFFLNDGFIFMNNKSFYPVKIRPKDKGNLNIKLYSSFIKYIINQYNDVMYHSILKEYLPRKLNRLKKNHPAKLITNQYYINNLLQADFKPSTTSHLNDNNSNNIILDNDSPSKKPRNSYNTVVNKFNPIFKKMILYTSSFSLNLNKTKQLIFEKDGFKKGKQTSILTPQQYSRGDFDVNK